MGILSELIKPQEDKSKQEELLHCMKEIGIDVSPERVAQILSDCRGEFPVAFDRLLGMYVPKVASSSPEISPSSASAINRKRQLVLLNRENSKKRRDSMRHIKGEVTGPHPFLTDDVNDVTEKENAVKTLCRAVESSNSNTIQPSSDNFPSFDWREEFLAILDLPVTPTILTELLNLCHYTAELRDAHVAVKEKFNLLRFCSEAVNDLAVLSPTPSEKQPRIPTPTDDTIESHKLNVKELTFESPDVNAVNSSFLPQKIVNCVKNMCEAYVARLDWGESTEQMKKTFHSNLEKQIQVIVQKKRQQSREWSANATAAREKLNQRQQQIRDVEDKLYEIVAAYARDQKLENKNNSLHIAAYLDVIHSSRADVMGYLSNRESHKQNQEKERKYLVKLEKHGDFITCCDRLFVAISKERERLISENIKEFCQQKKILDDLAIDGLLESIPVLCTALHRFGQYYHKRWKKSESKLLERRHELEEHNELFGQDAPQERKQLEVRVREYQNISLNCCTALQQMASSQATFWSNCYARIPEKVRALLISEFRLLYEQQGASAMKEMLGNFLAMNAAPTTLNTSIQQEMLPVKGTNKLITMEKLRSESSGDAEMIDMSDDSPTAEEEHQFSSYRKSADITTGTVIVTRFKVGANNKYVRGVVVKCLDNGSFSVEYSDGDIHENIERKHLLTETDLALHASEGFNMENALEALREPNHDPMMSAGNSSVSKEDSNTCSIM